MNTKTPEAVASNAELGPLPETTLAEVRNDFMNRSRLSETGVAYWGNNWYEVRKLYTVEQMRAYGQQEQAAERERCAEVCRLHADQLRREGLLAQASGAEDCEINIRLWAGRTPEISRRLRSA